MEGMEETTKAMAALRQKVDADIKDHKQGTEKQLNLVRTDMARQLASLTHQFGNGVSPLPQPTPAPTSGDSTSWMAADRDEPLTGPSLMQHPAQVQADEGDVIKLMHKAVLPDPDAHDAPHVFSPPDAPEPELGFQLDLRTARPLKAGSDEAMPLDLLLPGHNKSSPGSRLLARLTLKRCVSDDAVPASLRCAAIVVGKRLFLFPKGRDGMCDLQFAMVFHPSAVPRAHCMLACYVGAPVLPRLPCCHVARSRSPLPLCSCASQTWILASLASDPLFNAFAGARLLTRTLHNEAHR